MKNIKIVRLGLAALCMASVLHANAQSSLTDYSREIDLGMGVKQSQLLSTASTQTISGEELQKTAAISLKDALYGRLLGLTALKNGGFVGEDGYGATMNVRGIQTTSENNLLILVDGIKRSIDYLTVDEVESVTVLRDAAAVALLGYEGVNGAILVTTRRGKEGRSVSVSYNHKFTFNPQIAKFVDAFTYANAMNQARENDGLAPMYNPYELNAFAEGTHPYYYPDVNWKREMFKNVGSEDQLNLSLSGGNEKVKYFTMLDYTGSQGLLRNADQGDYSSQLKFSKANVRANLDVQLTATTTMGVNALGSFLETNRPADAGAGDLTWMLYQTPASAFPVMNNPEGDLNETWGGNTTYGMNNVAAKIQATGFQKSHARLFQGDLTLRQDLNSWLQGLSVAVRFGYNHFSDIYERNSKGFLYGYQRYNFDQNNHPAGLTTYQAGDKTENLNFSKWMNQHSRSSYLALSADYVTSFRADDNLKASLVWHQSNETSDGRYKTYNRMNWIGYLHYDLKQKYMADLVLAANGSNRSYPQKWSFSPTVSLGYIYANDAESGGLNFGKLRLSAGIQHTDYVPKEGLWLENYDGGGGDYYFGAGAGSQSWGSFISFQPTSSFKLETAYKFNIGTDLRLARSVDVSVDAYYQYRDNILLSGDGLNSTVVGIPSSYVNWGRVASYGVELGINYVKEQNKDLSYNLGAQFTWGRNEVLRTIENVAYNYLSAKGARVNQAWGLQNLGFFKDEADIAGSPRQEFDNCRPGDVKYRDQNGDEVINENDVVKMGYDTAVPELNYAFNLGIRYKNWGLNALLQGAALFTQYCNTTGMWTPMVDGANLSKEYYQNCWGVSEHPSYPRLTSVTNHNNYRENDIWYQNVNFLKLRNCEIYYLLPDAWTAKMKLGGCKFFVKGENLFTLTNLKEMDPENIGTNYPTLMGVNIGLSLKF